MFKRFLLFISNIALIAEHHSEAPAVVPFATEGVLIMHTTCE